MEVLMGGSGSTGSSLLKNILNRHEDVFSGGETAFFAKKMIYDQWARSKSRVLKRKFLGLRNHGWHIYNGTDLLQPEYLWQLTELKDALIESKTLQDFTTTFYQKPMQKSGASIWLEKTPANAACFHFFLREFEEGKVIHMVRNPFDTIASLVSRGFNVFYATGIYLMNTSSGLAAKKYNASYAEVKYEDLTLNPTKSVEELCMFLGISFSKHMLEPQGEVVHKPKLDGWQYDETKAIGKGSVGRFKKLSQVQQDEIIEAVNYLRINKGGKAYYGIQVESVEDICHELGYEFYSSIGKRPPKALKKLLVKDRFNRLRRGYPTGIYYPLEIKS